MEPSETSSLVIESERAWQCLGDISYGPGEKEVQSRQYRRSLYIVEDVKVGDRVTTENMRAIRPGLGLPPKYYDVLLGKRVKRDIKRGTAVSWALLD